MFRRFSCLGILFPRTRLSAAAMAAVWATTLGAAPVDDLRSLSIEELMSIEVTTSSRQTEKLIGAATAIEAITSEDIHRFGAFGLPEALALSTGLQVARSDVRTWAISARGFNTSTANKMQVMLDGRLLYTPLYSGIFWDAQNTVMDDIARIEVVRGPGATLWGSNSVNGVVNIITKEASETQGWLVEAGLGDFHKAFGLVRYGGRISDTAHFRVYGKSESDDELPTLGGQAGQDERTMSQAGFRLDAYRDTDDRFTLQGDIYSGRHGIAGEDDGVISGGNILGRWSHIVGPRSEFEARAYYDRTHRQLSGVFAEDRDTFDLDFQNTWESRQGDRFVWGANFNYSSSSIETDAEISFDPSERRTRSLSAFAQYQRYFVPEKAGAIAGAKFERNTLGGTDVQPSLRLFWRIDDDNTLWGGVSRAARKPTQLDTDFRIFGPGGASFLRGNPDFDSEKVTAYELGYRSQLTSNLSLDLALFRNEYKDLRSVEFDPDTPFAFRLDNLHAARSEGAEASVNLRVTEHWTLQGGAVFLDVDFRARSGGAPFGPAVEGNDPEHWFHVRSSVDFGSHWTVSANFRYTGALPDPAVPSRSDLDLRVSWQLSDEWEIALMGQSLLDPAHPEFGSQAPEASQIPRQFFAKATWRY